MHVCCLNFNKVGLSVSVCFASDHAGGAAALLQTPSGIDSVLPPVLRPSTPTIFATRECGVMRFSRISFCVLIFRKPSHRKFISPRKFIIGLSRCIFRIFGSCSYIKAVGSRSRSQERKCVRGWPPSTEMQSSAISAILYSVSQKK